MKRTTYLLALSAAAAITLTMATSGGASERADTHEYQLTEALPAGGTPGAPLGADEDYGTLVSRFFKVAPDKWGGAFVDGDRLVVRAVGNTPQEADRLLAKSGLGPNIEVVSGTRSMADLDELVAQVLDLRLPAVATVGPMYAREQVVVGLLRNDPDAIAKVLSIDPDAFTFYLTSPPRSASRYFDTSPFYGANQIVLQAAGSAGGSACSSAFAWNDIDGGTDTYLVTAAHCYAEGGGAGRSIVKRVVNTSPQSWLSIGTVGWSSGNNYGTVSGRRGDVATYKLNTGLSALPRIYVGPCDTTSTRLVTGQVVLPEGWMASNVYTSGSGCAQRNGTGEVALDWISLVNQTVVYTNVSPAQTFNTISFGENASTCIGEGDSGGAVYTRRSGGEARAVGVISGSNGAGVVWTNCRNYYTPISVVTEDFGGSLKVAAQ